MRIIGGKWKGLTLPYQKNISARPTTDRAKEALFNILIHRYEMEGKRVLDLFTGTGSIALEFISRGVANVVAVDQDIKPLKNLQQFCKTHQIKGIKIHKSDVLAFLNREKIDETNESQRFDFIFADPPYHWPKLADLPLMVKDSGLLRQGGLFMLEHPKGFPFPVEASEERNYGQSAFSFYEG